MFLSFAGRSAAQSGREIDRSFLTNEERLWLESHRAELCVVPEASYPPLSFADAGVWRGLSADMLRLVEAKLGAKFTVLAPQNLDTILARAQKGEPGIVTSVRETPERSQYLSFTPTYVSIPTVIIVKADSSLARWPEAFAGKKVAVGKGYGVQSFLEQKFPALKLVLTPDDLDGLRRLSFGEIDAVITDMASASFLIEKGKITNLRVLGTLDYVYDLSLAVRRDLPVLREILTKTLRAIAERDRQAVLKHWIQLETDPLTLLREKYQRFLSPGLAVFMALLAAGAMGWIIALRRRLAPRNLAVALSLLAAGMALTGVVTFYAKTDAERDARRKFDFASDEIRLNIVARLRACAQVLHSGAALFDASESVERAEWRAFTRGLQLSQQLPGIQGVGFAQYLPRTQLAEHEQAIRREGFPEYQVKPVGDRETYSAIIYLEPFSDRNLRAFGFDMLAEPVRRTAMERARDEHAAALSGKVILVQETGEEVQAGTLMYVPVYHHGALLETVEQRRAALQGWVYSPYRMGDLIRGTLRDWHGSAKDQQIVLQVYDGEVLSAENVLFDTRSAADKVGADPHDARLVPVDFAGRRWTLRFSPIGGLAATADYASAWFALSGGTVVSLLLFWLALSLLNTRANAQRIAAQLTQELRQSEKHFAMMADAAPVLIWESGPDKLCTYFNKPWLDFTGRTSEQEMGNGWAEGVHPDDLARCLEIYVGSFDARREFKMEYRLRRHDGQYRWLLVHGVPRFHADGTFAGYIGSCIDINERRETAVRLHLQSVAMNAAASVIVITDTHGVIEWVNQAFTTTTGYTLSEAIGRTPSLLKSGLHSEEFYQKLWATITAGEVWHGEFHNKRKDGTIYIEDAKIAPVKNQQGVITHFIALKTDITERKLAADRLRENEERFHVIFEDSPDAYLIMEIQDHGRISACNAAAETMLRGTKAQIIGMTPDAVSPKYQPNGQLSAEAVKDRIRYSMAHGRHNFEWVHRRMDGEDFWAHVTVATIAIEGRQVLLVSWRDITERKQIENELKVNQQRLALALEQAQLAYWEMDGATATFTFNDRFYALYGTTAEREGGYRMTPEVYAREFLLPEEQHIVAPDVARLLSGKIDEIEADHRIRRRDGELRHVHVRISAVRNEAGRIVGTRGVNQDITERKLAEKALQESEEQFRSVVRSMSEGLVLQQPDGAIIDCNQQAERILGLTREQILGRTSVDPRWRAVKEDGSPFPGEEHPAMVTLRTGRRCNNVVMGVHLPEGTFRWININTEPMLHPGEVMLFAVVTTFAEITDRLAQQHKLQELLEQTERDAQTKGELLKEVNHRVTNNLTAVLGLMVYERESVTDHDRHLVAPTLDRLQQRIRGLLTVHRMLSQTAWAPVNLARLAEEIIRAALSAAPWRNQAVVTIEPSSLRVSPRQAGGLALIFNELTTNTVKYAHLDSHPVKLIVGIRVDETGTTITYRDNGPGYATDVLKNQRSNIGLKLIRDLVATTLGGTVELENDAGAKTTIRLRPELETRT